MVALIESVFLPLYPIVTQDTLSENGYSRKKFGWEGKRWHGTAVYLRTKYNQRNCIDY
jgi:hypothetical protein